MIKPNLTPPIHQQRRSNNMNNNSMRGSMISRGSRDRFRGSFNKHVQSGGGDISHRLVRRNEDGHTRRISEGRAESSRQYRSTSGSASRDRSNWDRSSQHNHIRSRQPQAVKRARLEQSASPPKKFKSEESRVTESPLPNDIEDGYVSRDEEQSSKKNFTRLDSFSSTR